MLARDERFGSNELAERLSESTERPGKPRGRDAGRVQDSEAAHLNSPERALESQISVSHLVPLLEFNRVTSGQLGTFALALVSGPALPHPSCLLWP